MQSQLTRFRSLPQNVTLAVHWVQLNSLNSIWQQLLLLRSVIFWRLGKKYFKVCYDFFPSSRVLSNTFLFLWKYNYTSCSKQPQWRIRTISSNSVVGREVNCWEKERFSRFFQPIRVRHVFLQHSVENIEKVKTAKKLWLFLVHKQNL